MVYSGIASGEYTSVFAGVSPMPLSDEVFIPHPNIVMLGCAAWPPSGQIGTCCLGCGADVDADEPRCRACGTRIPLSEGPCPVHGEAIRAEDDRVYCGWCDSTSARTEAKIRQARIGIAAQTRAEHAEADAKTELRRRTRGRPQLTEVERRR